MPPRLPPTPATSGELNIKDHSIDTMPEHSFALPPAALSPLITDDSSSSSRKGSVVFQPPVSPASPDTAALGSRRMSTASSRAGTKRGASTSLDEFNLPPPPTRTRKIIQMKPKTSSSSTVAASGSGASNSSTVQTPQKNASKSAANSRMATTAVINSSSSAVAQQQPSPNSTKKKQPSATSAAGRKIARKTAHSLIERRRRSKMNEEFATLKNMIPACRGQEMHKLAILQASIDYMNYLEECITELKTASSGKNNQRTKTPRMTAPPGPPSPTSPELMIPDRVDEESYSTSSSPSSATSPSMAAVTSPAFSPHTMPTNPQQSQSIENSYYTILPSPALGPLHSPRPQQTQQQQSNNNNNNTWRTPSQPLASATPSPAILPQQHRHSISSSYTSSTTSGTALENDSIIDHEASAALLMLNMDRRGTGPASVEESAQRSSLAAEASARDRKMGMSVRDLLAP